MLPGTDASNSDAGSSYGGCRSPGVPSIWPYGALLGPAARGSRTVYRRALAPRGPRGAGNEEDRDDADNSTPRAGVLQGEAAALCRAWDDA
jgi:hypothetical protein